MKKLVSIYICVMLIFIAGCHSNQSIGEENKQQSVEYTVYQNISSAVGLSSLTPALSTDNIAENIKIGNISEVSFMPFSRQEDISCEGKKQETNIKIGDRNITLPILASFSSKLYLSEDEKLQPYGLITVYKDNSAEIRYNEKGYLKTYVVFDEDLKNAGGILELEKADSIAKDTVKNLYGDNLAKKYELINYFMSEDETTVTSVLYGRKLYGYETNDTIQIQFNGSGEIVGITANYVGIYDDINGVPSKEEIEKAEAALMTVISKEMSVGSKELVIDSTGKVFLRVLAGRTVMQEQYEPISDLREFYINIQ